MRLPSVISPDFFRRRLANVEALPQLALLAGLTGLLTGAVILLFRYLIEQVLANWFLAGDYEAFETLNALQRTGYAVGGALLVGLALAALSRDTRRVGVVHVMERLSRHQGYLPLRNALVQFLGGIAALASGQSGGREGPSIHLGAAAASVLGQTFRLPNNSIRTLVGCGTAAAIASSFNTPMAGVIFAMEVVMMEYTIGSFIPVIIAAVTSTFLTHLVLGNEPAFTIAPLQLMSLAETPFIILAGVLIGAVAAGFIALIQMFASFGNWPIVGRMALAGTITGALALHTPEIMGVGYDTVSAAMLGQLTLTALFVIAIAKLVASAAATGLGMPVGLIGPTLVIGAALGAVMAQVGRWFDPAVMSGDGFYVMLGMSAMMAAVLQAPLAALVSVLELTANPNVILPAMLIIVVATMITSEVFKSESVFLRTLRTLGLEYPPSPVTQHLSRVGVTALMERSFQRLPAEVSISASQEALKRSPRWILIDSADGDVRTVLDASDLRAYLDDLQDDASAKVSDTEDAPSINLLRIPGMRKDIGNVDSRATLQEALLELRSKRVEALCVKRYSAPMIKPIIGVLTKDQIDSYREVG
ncbi:MAG: chloride channel protein [Pseudomonadota bacterium]